MPSRAMSLGIWLGRRIPDNMFIQDIRQKYIWSIVKLIKNPNLFVGLFEFKQPQTLKYKEDVSNRDRTTVN